MFLDDILNILNKKIINGDIDIIEEIAITYSSVIKLSLS